LSLSTLVERYFYSPLQEDEEEQKKENARIDSAAAFVRTDHFPEFKDHLEKLRKSCEPKAGQPESMLYQCGVRDGIDKVLDHLNDLVEKVKEKYE